jgi:hypothetical protein
MTSAFANEALDILNDPPDPPRLPGDRKLSSEETAIAQFKLLVDTYAAGITTINGKIGGKRAEVEALLAGVKRLEGEIATMEQERNTKFDLMEGVNTLIRKQEDLIRERERAEADAARREAAIG